MNIRSASWDGASQNALHHSEYLYGLDKELLPPRRQQSKEQIVLTGHKHLDILYQYRHMEGWLGDVPVSFTYLMAYRSYENTKQIFTRADWSTASTNMNSWLV